MACIAELSWLYQMSSGMYRVSSDLQSLGVESCLFYVVDLLSYLVLILGVSAESCSYICTATQNNLFCAAESTLWMSIFICFTPCCVYLLVKLYDLPSTSEKGFNTAYAPFLYSSAPNTYSAKVFGIVMILAGTTYITIVILSSFFSFHLSLSPSLSLSDLSLLKNTGVFYIPYEYFVDIPMYLTRYHQDTASGKVYLSFVDGIKDSLFTRVVSQDWDLWWHSEWYA
jgi:hypothetical protein